MALTAAEEAEYQSLIAQYRRPTLPERFAVGTANLMSTFPDDLLGGSRNLLNMVKAGEPIEKVDIPNPLTIPRAQGWKEGLTDLGPQAVSVLATIAVPQVAATRGLGMLGMAPRMANIAGAAIGSGLYGANQSPESAAIQGGTGALGRATDFLGRGARIPIALASGAISGMDAYSQGASPVESAAVGLVDAGSSFIFKQQHLPFPLKPVPTPAITADEMIPPSGRWNKATRISDAVIEEIPAGLPGRDMQARLPYQEGAVSPQANLQLENGRAIIPRGVDDVTPPTPSDPLAFSHRLYDRQLADAADRAPFILKDGVITPTFESRKLLQDAPDLPPERAAVATLQTPLPKPPIHEIRPAFKSAAGQELVGEMHDTHEMILNRHLNENVDDADTLLNFDTKENPNYFKHGDRVITRAELKEMYGVKDSQGLSRLQKATEPPPPSIPIAPEVEVEPEVIPPKVETPLTPSGRKSRAKPLDSEKFMDGNDLRLVPGKGKGGIEFESMRDVAPGAGKLKFTVPEGTSHAEANKLFKAKKKELLATLQTGDEVVKPTVPFQDVPSSKISEEELNWRGLGTENAITPTGLKKLRERRGDGGTFTDIITKAIAEPALGALAGGILGGMATGDAVSTEDKITGIVQGAMAGGILTTLGMKGIRFLMDAKTPHMSQGFKEVAQQAARGQGSSLSHFARWLESNFTGNPTINRILTMASGEAHMAAKSWDQSLRYLSRQVKTLPQHLQDMVHDYATAEPFMERHAFARLQTQISDPKILEAALLERHTRINAQEMALEGLDPKSDMYKKIKDSFGTYQKTAYRIHYDPKFKPTQAQIDAGIQELYFNGPKGMSWDDSRAIVEQYLHETYIERGLTHMARRYSGNKGAENLGDILRKKNPELLQRPAFREMLGEVTDPLQVRAATALKLIPAVRSGQFFNGIVNAKTELGNRFAITMEERNGTLANLRAQIGALLSGTSLPTAGPHQPVATLQAQLRELENYVLAPESPSLGLLSGKYVHRQVHDRLPSHEGIFEGNGGPIIDTMMAFNNHVKAAKVGANPLSWTRAMASIPFFMVLGRGGTPMNWVAAHREMYKKGPLWREATSQGMLSAGYGTGEAKRDLGILLDPTITETGVSKLWSKWVSIGAGVMDYGDSVVRMASYMNNKARFKAREPHLSEQQLRDKTTEYVNDFTMNYSTTPKGVRVLRQMPFVNQFLTYASEISRITKNHIREVATNKYGDRMYAIAALAAIPAVFETAQYIFENNLSDKDKAEWKKVKQLLPDFKKYGYLLPTGKAKDGTWDYLNISPLFVADDIARMVKSIAAGDIDAVKANNPIMGWDNTPAITVGSAAAGYDMRYGRELPTVSEKLNVIRKEVLPPLIGGYEIDNLVNALTPNKDGTLGIRNERTGQRFEVHDLLFAYASGIRKSNIKLSILQERELALADRRVRAIESDLSRVLQMDRRPEAEAAAKQAAKRKVQTILQDLEQKVRKEE